MVIIDSDDAIFQADADGRAPWRLLSPARLCFTDSLNRWWISSHLRVSVWNGWGRRRYVLTRERCCRFGKVHVHYPMPLPETPFAVAVPQQGYLAGGSGFLENSLSADVLPAHGPIFE